MERRSNRVFLLLRLLYLLLLSTIFTAARLPAGYTWIRQDSISKYDRKGPQI